MKRTEEQLDAKQILSVIEKYSLALDLLDAYDHQNMKRPEGGNTIYILSYQECQIGRASCRERVSSPV